VFGSIEEGDKGERMVNFWPGIYYHWKPTSTNPSPPSKCNKSSIWVLCQSWNCDEKIMLTLKEFT
jgi:hypothetical protein